MEKKELEGRESLKNERDNVNRRKQAIALTMTTTGSNHLGFRCVRQAEAPSKAALTQGSKE
jgi:hypothetical protein